MVSKNMDFFQMEYFRRFVAKSKKGNVLVLVIILFMFVSILALGILAMAESETRIMHYDERHDQAYYIARSVVAATETWISAKYQNRDELKKVVPEVDGGEKDTPGELDGSKYILSVKRQSLIDEGGNDTGIDVITIKAIATFDGVSASAKMSLFETISGKGLFDDAIYSISAFDSGGNMNLVPMSPPPSVSTGGYADNNNNGYVDWLAINSGDSIYKINKNLYFDRFNPSGPDGSTNYDGPAIIFKPMDFEAVDPNIDSFVNYPDEPEISSTITISSNTLFPNNLTLYDYATIIVNNVLEDGIQPQDIHIRIDGDLVIDGSGNADKKPIIKVASNSGGKVFIYVYGMTICENPASLAIEGDYDNDGSATPAIYLILNGPSGDITLIGNPNIHAYVYAPTTNVHFGGNADFYGAVIANQFGWNGGITMNYIKPPSFIGTPFEPLDQNSRKIDVDNQKWIVD